MHRLLPIDDELTWRRALRDLPEFEPPVELWQRIAASAPQRRRSWPALASAAALTLVLLGAWQLKPASAPAPQLASSAELAPVALMAQVQALEQQLLLWAEQKPLSGWQQQELLHARATLLQIDNALERAHSQGVELAVIDELWQQRLDQTRRLGRLYEQPQLAMRL